MITRRSTLADVCFAVSHALRAHGIDAVLTGGSAAALYAPQICSSYDADFVLESDEPLGKIADALLPTGFTRNGKSRMFVHPNSGFTIDFPRGPLAVGGDYVHETATLANGEMMLRILSPTDCVRDRLAHFYHWDDYTALNAAVAVAAAKAHDVLMDVLRSWSAREERLAKFAEFELRLKKQSR